MVRRAFVGAGWIVALGLAVGCLSKGTAAYTGGVPDEYRVKYEVRECVSTKDKTQVSAPQMRYYLVQSGSKFTLLELDAFGEGLEFAEYTTDQSNYTFLSYPKKKAAGDAIQFVIPRSGSGIATRLVYPDGSYEIKKTKGEPATIEGSPSVRCELVDPTYAGKGEPSAAAPTSEAPAKAEPKTTACVPGQTQECVGPGACKGGQVCLPDGSGYGPCDCGPGGK